MSLNIHFFFLEKEESSHVHDLLQKGWREGGAHD